jgi:hypothetical protein
MRSSGLPFIVPKVSNRAHRHLAFAAIIAFSPRRGKGAHQETKEVENVKSKVISLMLYAGLL